MTPHNAILKVVRMVGGQTHLARLVGTNQSTVRKWLYEAKRVSHNYVLAVERAVNGAVTRHQLRPDLYPEE